MTSVVLWLREYGVDIGCIEVSARRVIGANQAVISARQLLPLPEAEDYLVRRRRKEQEEEKAREAPAEWTWDGYAARFHPEQLSVARRLYDELTRYVEEHELRWTPALRAWWLGYQRAGGYYVPLITLRRENPIEFSVKLPDDPERLNLTNPYPSLKTWWDGPNRQWTWSIPSPDDVPDLSLALGLSRKLQPERGPMPRPGAESGRSDGDSAGGEGDSQAIPTTAASSSYQAG